MAKHKYISFSAIRHDFTFLDSHQFPVDVRIVRVDYNPHPGCALRLIIESDTYEDLPLDEVLKQPGLTLMQHVREFNHAHDGVIQFASYDEIPPQLPEGRVLFVNLVQRRQAKVPQQ